MRRASLTTRLALLCGASVALPTLFACLDHPLKPVEYEPSQEETEGIQIAINKDVDILFVIDNSGSMGEEQANLSANFAAFINVLEADDVKANYRIGITTTDNGNPVCAGGSPEAGALVLSSCLSRLQQFTFGTGMAQIDASTACTDFCNIDNIDVQPTSTKQEPDAKPRPWLENIDGTSNLPDGVSTVEAFQCLGPQGIDGCGFESHLESMSKALRRATLADEESYGFLRDGAILSIVFVTDELDCSAGSGPEQRDAFRPEGERVFWSDKDAGFPTSAVCWNAGVTCAGGPGTYEDCSSEDKGPDGNPSGADDAILVPVERYVSEVQLFEDEKQQINPDQEVLVAAIAGVPSGYPDSDLVYQDAPGGASPNNPIFQEDFGIGPGCTSAVAEAVPPVRIREFARAFQVGDDNNLFSVCDEDYSPALRAIADLIRDQIKPACMPACVADQDPLTEQVEPSCVLTQRLVDDDGGTSTSPIPPCADFDGELPDDADVCYVALGDKEGSTPEDNDDLEQECIDQGWNLQFRVFRRAGVPAGGGTSVSATCELSQSIARDCPLLPG